MSVHQLFIFELKQSVILGQQKSVKVVVLTQASRVLRFMQLVGDGAC